MHPRKSEVSRIAGEGATQSAGTSPSTGKRPTLNMLLRWLDEDAAVSVSGIPLSVRVELCLFLGACTGSPDLGSSAQAIIGGTADLLNSQVVMLVSYPQDHSYYDTCTAELIAPSLLVTAAHCVDAADHVGLLFGIFTDQDGSQFRLSALTPVGTVTAHPQYDSTTSANDIGVVELLSPLLPAPLALNRTAADPTWVSAAAEISGYGLTNVNDPSSAYVRNHAVTQVVDFNSAFVQVGDSTRHTCVGDSGGAAIMTIGGARVLIGVDSHGPPGCTDPSQFTRMDTQLGFLDPYLPNLDMASAPDPFDAATDLGVAGGAADLGAIGSPNGNMSGDTSHTVSSGRGCSFATR